VLYTYSLYLGNVPSLIISDPDVIKEITVKQFGKFTNRVVSGKQ